MDIFQWVLERTEVRVSGEVSGQHWLVMVGSELMSAQRELERAADERLCHWHVQEVIGGLAYLVKRCMFETAAAAGLVTTARGMLKGVVVVEMLSCSRGGNVNGGCTNEKEQNWWCVRTGCVGRRGRRTAEEGRDGKCLQRPALVLPNCEVIWGKVQYGEERTSLHSSSRGSRNDFDVSRGKDSKFAMAVGPRGMAPECRSQWQLISRYVQL